MIFHSFIHLNSSLPSFIQIATNGNWEEAIRFAVSDTNWHSLVDFTVSDLAIEVFFESPDIFMFGFRYNRNLVASRAEFMNSIVEAAQEAKSPLEFSQLIATFFEKQLLQTDVTECTRIELGILDFWKSQQAFEIWHIGLSKLIPHPFIVPKHLWKNVHNMQMLEFSATDPVIHWVGLGVGQKEDNYYLLDDIKLDDFLYQHGKLAFEVDPEVEAQWMIEIQRRIESVRTGKTRLYTHEEVMSELKNQKEKP